MKDVFTYKNLPYNLPNRHYNILTKVRESKFIGQKERQRLPVDLKESIGLSVLKTKILQLIPDSSS